MSKKSEKIEKKSKKFLSQKLVIWSGNSAEFLGLKSKKRKKSFFIRFCTGPHWARHPDWAYDLAISGQVSCKMSKTCDFSSKKVVTCRGKTQEIVRKWFKHIASLWF